MRRGNPPQSVAFTTLRKGLTMIIGKVVGSVVSTRKNEKLIGCKFMVIEPLESYGNPQDKIIAIDNIGAGISETVLVATGSAARIGSDMENAPVDAAIVGIIDSSIGLSGVSK